MPKQVPARSSTALMVAVGVTTTNTECGLSTTQWYSAARLPKIGSVVQRVVGRLHSVAGGGERKRCKFPLDKQYRIFLAVCAALAAAECQPVRPLSHLS